MERRRRSTVEDDTPVDGADDASEIMGSSGRAKGRTGGGGPRSPFMEYRTEIPTFDREGIAKRIRALAVGTLEDCLALEQEVIILLLEGHISDRYAEVIQRSIDGIRKTILAKKAGDSQDNIIGQLNRLSSLAGAKQVTLGIGASMTLDIPDGVPEPLQIGAQVIDGDENGG